MKFKKLKVARMLGGALGLLLALSLVLVPTPVLAVPQMPHQFYGTVTIDAELAPEGIIVSARIAGVEYLYTTVDAEGRYGYAPTFKVPADDPDEPGKQGGVAGETVEFYIGLDEVKANETALFEIWGTTELPLTVGEVDTTPPTVVSTIPEAGATGTIDVIVRATFDEAIDEATLVFTLDSVAGSVAGTPSYDSSTKTASFTPDANLDYEITYTASIQASDLAGNAMAAAHTWSFTTVVNNPPTVSEPSPADQATNVSTSPQLSVLASDLDEDLMAVTFYDASDDSVIGTTVEGAASGTRPSVIWAGLDYEVQYSWYVKVSDGINPEVTSDTWSFTTRAEGPVSFTAPLSAGWNLLSTPIKLDADSDTLEQILGESLANIDASYRWDTQTQKWAVPTGYELSPLEAVYLKVKTGASATAEFFPFQELSSLPSRELQAGVNLIGIAPALEAGVFPAKPLDQALISIAQAKSGLRGYTMVVSPPHNQPGWAYELGGQIRDLVPYKGYWVVMDNADTLYGSSITPIP